MVSFHSYIRIPRRILRSIKKKLVIWLFIFFSLIINKHPIFFIHIGKNAGSSMRYELLKLKSSHFKIYFLSHAYTFKDIPKGYKIVFVIRDPQERFVSTYYSRRKKGQPTYFVEWSNSEKEFFNKYKDFTDVLRDIRQKPDSLWAYMRDLQHIRQGYSYYLYGNEYIASREEDIFFILNINYLENDLKNFSTLLGIRLNNEIEINHLHRRQDTQKLANEDQKYIENFLNKYSLSEIQIFKYTIEIWNKRFANFN